jgi:PIN domain nuclease of toxin-antitoxin system
VAGRRPPLRLLLDSHVLVWSFASPHRLRAEALSAIADSANHVHVSTVSPWELEIKRSTGKIEEMPEDVLERIDRAGFIELPVSFEHGIAAGRLPLHHGDPFDRMLVAQARLEGLTLVTDDAQLTRYNVPILRA